MRTPHASQHADMGANRRARHVERPAESGPRLGPRLGLLSVLLVGVMLLAPLTMLTSRASAQPGGALEVIPAPPAFEALDLWSIIELNGERAGWTRLATRLDDGRITTISETRMAIRRGPIEIVIKMESRFVESEAGEPVSLWTSRELGAAPIEAEYTFDGDTIRVRSTQGGRTTTSTMDRPGGDWLTPHAAMRVMREALDRGDAQIELQTVDMSEGFRIMSMKRTEIEPTQIEVVGRTTPGFRSMTTTSVAPGMVVAEWMDIRGIPVRTETSMAGMKLVTVLADRDLATAKVDAPELMESTFVRPSRVIPNADGVRRGVYLLSLPEAPMPELLSVGGQVAETDGDGAVRVEVVAGRTSAASAEDVADTSLLGSSQMLRHDDPEVVRLTREALRNAGATPLERAEALRGFVFEYVDAKSLGVGFASASEVARTREGDCSEHAVLLTAMLRSAGIPSRVASGLVYVERFLGGRNIFGYHMWSQALIETDEGLRWIDLDATRPASIQHSATHITLAASAMDDGASNALVELVPLIGQLKIEVLELDAPGPEPKR